MKFIDEMKIDSKAFYRYAKHISVIHSKICPLNIEGKYVHDEKEMSDIFSKLYEDVCSSPH